MKLKIMQVSHQGFGIVWLNCMVITHWVPALSPSWVKLSGVRQSKNNKEERIGAQCK